MALFYRLTDGKNVIAIKVANSREDFNPHSGILPNYIRQVMAGDGYRFQIAKGNCRRAANVFVKHIKQA